MQFASMSLGIFDFLIEWLTQFLIWIVEFALGIVQQLIAGILYSTCVNFLEIVNYIQKIFYKLCGLDTYWYGGTEMKGTDPLISIITEKSMLQVLLALTLVAVAMVIVATIIQVLRTEFSTEGSKNTKGQVFGQAIKAVIMFALVPICCGGGILITNALLKAVNVATSLGAESSVGGAIYVASTYGSNKIRNGGTITIVENNITVVGAETGLFGSSQKTKTITVDDTLKQNLAKLGIASSANQTNRDDVAQAIDNAFRSGYFDFKNHEVAKCFYDVGSINYIIFLFGGVLAAYTMLMASFGMIMRMYKGAVLFVISPAMSGLMPLDNGKAFARWRESFIKQILSAYGTIVAMNLLFILLPIISNISLFGASDFAWKGGLHANLSNDVGKINAFVQMLFALTGLFMLKDMSGIIAGMIGADDAGAAGAGMAGKVLGAATKIGTVAAGGAGLAMKGLGAGSAVIAKHTNGKVSDAFGGLSKTLGGVGNTFTRKAAGTAAGAFNKAVGTMTGGEIKDVFNDEKDYDKYQKAKKERADAIKNGTITPGLKDIVKSGVKSVPKVLNSGVTAVDKTIQTVKQKRNEHVLDNMADEGRISNTDYYQNLERIQQEGIQNRKKADDRGKKRATLGAGFAESLATGGSSTMLNLEKNRSQAKASEEGLGNVAASKDKLADALDGFMSKFSSAVANKDTEAFAEAIASLAEQAGDVKDIESLLRSLNSRKATMDSLGTMDAKRDYLSSLRVGEIITEASAKSEAARTTAAEIRNSITNNITASAGKVDLNENSLSKIYEETIEAIQHKGVTLTQTEINSLKKTFGEETKKAIEEAQKRNSGK